MAFNPCGCGNNMDGAKRYIKKPVIVLAKKMDRAFAVQTLEGLMRGNAGDYLVQGIRGESYPVRGDIFEETYEPAPERV